MSKVSTKNILYQNVCSSCTKPMCINHIHHTMCQKISSMVCINYIPLSICQHVHLSICQPCTSTNMPTMCIYQYANHVHLPICQPCNTNDVLLAKYSSSRHKHVHQHLSLLVPSKYINHALIPQQDESSYMYAKSSIKHVPLKPM
jgi:hypothetical protein